MKIVFATAHIKAPSAVFYTQSLTKINQLSGNHCLDVSDNPFTVDYGAYDVALFMGYDPAASLAKSRNPMIQTAVLDPRGGTNRDFSDVDVIIVQGLEAKDFFTQFGKEVLIYYTFPEVPPKLDCPVEKSKLILGYHGNQIHLIESVPRVYQAISRLAEEIALEFWAMYNIEKFGRWTLPKNITPNFFIRHIQYSEENYSRYIAHVDIGITPQFVRYNPSTSSGFLKKLLQKTKVVRDDYYYLKFKETTNIGRHLVFAQYGIPVVSDMAPSSCAFIEDEFDGFVTFSNTGWYQAIKKLARNPALRKKMGERLLMKYYERYDHDVLNRKLVAWFSKDETKSENQDS